MLMTEPRNPGPSRARVSLTKRLLAALLPLLFLTLTYLGLVSRYRFFGLPGEERITLAQQESQRLADQSKSLVHQGRYAEALKPTLTLYKAYPDNYIYLGRLADIYDLLGRYDEEARYWEKFMDHAPMPIAACPQIGQAYWKQGEKFKAQAVAAYQRCLALDPKNTHLLFYLAHAMEMSGWWTQAAEQYQKGLAISPGYTDFTLGLARCWLRLDRPNDARKLAEQILSKHPRSSGAFLVLGMFYLHQENYVEAKKVLTRGANMADTDPDFHILLARVAEQTNDYAQALRQYNRVLELRPEEAQARSRRDALAAQKASN
jgi:tetratricopeptide (TPR) repeat protein